MRPRPAVLEHALTEGFVMLSWHAYLIYCCTYAFLVAMPGPGVIAIIARALGNGFRPTVPAAFGMAAGDLTYMSFSVFGLAMLARTMGGLFLIVKLAGAAYLLYLGWQYWRAPSHEMIGAKKESGSRGFFTQYMITMGNPKAMAFFLAILPNFIDMNRITIWGWSQLASASVIILPIIILSYAAMAARLRDFLSSPRAQKRMNRGAALIMAGAGIGVAVS